MSGRVAFALCRSGVLIALGLSLSGCFTDRMTTGSIARTSASRNVATVSPDPDRARALSAKYGAAYDRNPSDVATAYAYGVSLRASGQRAQALAVLETAALKNPTQKQLLGAYGRALADAGRYDDALSVMQRAHTPESPDWRLLNAQGAVLDQLGRSADARGQYEAALKIMPGEPSILSNLGLSYALSNELGKAEATLAQAAMSPRADEKVRANLAMVQGLKARGATKSTRG